MFNKKQIKKVFLLSGLFGVLYGFTSYAVDIPKGLSIKGLEISGVSVDTAKEEVNKIADNIENKKIVLNIEDKKSNISFKDIDFKISNKEDILKELEESTKGNVVKRYVLASELAANPKTLEFDTTFNMDKLNVFVEESTKDLGNKAVNATIKKVGSNFVITESQDGIDIDKDSLIKKLKDSAIQVNLSNKDDIEIIADTVLTKAKVRKEELEKIKDVLGEYTTNFSSSSRARATNLENGTSKINGHLLMPGETLSGYACLQPFTIANGYKVGKAYQNGKVVDNIGGGVCQIATTLYNAALLAEVGITQRQNHSMIVGYVPASRDAAIAGTFKDIKITNNRETPIYVEGFTHNRNVTFKIWGQETRDKNRQIKFVSEILSETPAGITYVDDPTLPLGQEKKTESGHKGRSSRLWKVVTVNGKQVDKTLLNKDTYRMSNNVYLRGTKPLEETVEPALTNVPDATPQTNPNGSLVGPGANAEVVKPKPKQANPAKPKPAQAKPSEPINVEAPNMEMVPEGPRG